MERARPRSPSGQNGDMSPAANTPTSQPLVGHHHGQPERLGDDAPGRRDLLDELGIPHEARIVSAHRTPDWMFEYAEHGRRRAASQVIIAGAGGAAHLPGMVASKTRAAGHRRAGSGDRAPRAGRAAVHRPDAEGHAGGARMAIGKPGAANAALYAAKILALTTARAPRAARRRGRRPAPTRCSGRSSLERSEPPSCPGATIGHPGRRSARTDDGDGGALAGVPRARARSGPVVRVALRGGPVHHRRVRRRQRRRGAGEGLRRW